MLSSVLGKNNQTCCSFSSSFFFFLHRKEFVSKQLWVLCVITSVQPAALCCEMCRGRSLVVPLCSSPPCLGAACAGRACLSPLVQSVQCVATQCRGPMAVPLYLPPSSLSWGQGGGAESVGWRRGRQTECHPCSTRFPRQWDSLAFLCQGGESQPWRLQSDGAPGSPSWSDERRTGSTARAS